MIDDDAQNALRHAPGWEQFNQMLDDRLKPAVGLERALSEEDAKAINSAWAKFYETPDGKKAIEELFGQTLFRQVYLTAMNLTPEQCGHWGAFREGQNSIADVIRQRIQRGQGRTQTTSRKL